MWWVQPKAVELVSILSSSVNGFLGLFSSTVFKLPQKDGTIYSFAVSSVQKLVRTVQYIRAKIYKRINIAV